jgi:hypothetical protein
MYSFEKKREKKKNILYVILVFFHIAESIKNNIIKGKTRFVATQHTFVDY